MNSDSINIPDVEGTALPLFRAQEKLRFNFENILLRLNFDEWASLIFLVVDEVLHCPEKGFQYAQAGKGRKNDIEEDAKKTVINKISRDLCNDSCRNFNEAFDPILEALYIIGRLDILEGILGLCLEHHCHMICKNLRALPDDRVILYDIFSDLSPKDLAEIWVQPSMSEWVSPDLREPLELIFFRNVNCGNFSSLIRNFFEALRGIGRDDLSVRLHPYVRLDTYDIVPPKDNVYPLPIGHPHGLCIIINVKEFQEFAQPSKNENLIHLTSRYGSDIDCDRLEGTFKLFGFSILRLNNPGRMELENLFNNLRKETRFSAIACLALCIMTHGDFNDNLYLHDHSVLSMSDLRRLCYNKMLVEKPRLYFVQACRGEENLKPLFLQTDTARTSNAEVDTCIFAATVPGYRAIRSPSEGSWFISDLCTSLQSFGHSCRLSRVLMNTKQLLKDRVGKLDGEYVTQIAEDSSTLLKEVQLVRGEMDCFLEGIADLVSLNVIQDLLDDSFNEILAHIAHLL